jgi:hypothetical protein
MNEIARGYILHIGIVIIQFFIVRRQGWYARAVGTQIVRAAIAEPELPA